MKPRLVYSPGTTLLHRLHPLLKMAWLILLTAAVLVITAPAYSLFLLLAALAAFPLIGTRIDEIRGLRVLIFTAVLIWMLQIVFLNSGAIILTFGRITIHQAGFLRGAYLAARFLDVILFSYLFVLTTSPTDLAYALMRSGLPYRFGFSFVTALRMIPLFEEEILIISRAQQARGIAFREKGLVKIWSSIQSFTLPLLVSALKKVESLSISMEGRCFGIYPTRTYYRVREKYSGDWIGILIWILACGFIILIKTWEV